MFGKRLFKKYFEWVGDSIYIKVRDNETAVNLKSLFEWWEENVYDPPTADSIARVKANLDDDDDAILDKLDALYEYLGLEYSEVKHVVSVVTKKKGKN